MYQRILVVFSGIMLMSTGGLAPALAPMVIPGNILVIYSNFIRRREMQIKIVVVVV